MQLVRATNIKCTTEHFQHPQLMSRYNISAQKMNKGDIYSISTSVLPIIADKTFLTLTNKAAVQKFRKLNQLKEIYQEMN